MKYALRFVWYIVKIAAIASAVFAVLIVGFFVAMDSANVYVIVTDGMKARASSILIPVDDANLTKYFSAAYLKQQQSAVKIDLSDFVISNFNYKITVESLWCKPWENVATVTVLESIPEFNYIMSDVFVVTDKYNLPKPQWPKIRYLINCRRVDGVWRIYNVSIVDRLRPDPTMTPRPTFYIVATPVPSPTHSITPAPPVKATLQPAVTKK